MFLLFDCLVSIFFTFRFIEFIKVFLYIFCTVKKTRTSEDKDIEPTQKKKQCLPDIFQGIHAYIHPREIPEKDIKHYRRYLIAYPLTLD